MNPEPKLRAGINRLSLTLALLLGVLSTACATPPLAQIEGKNLVIPDDAGTARRLISIEHLYNWFRHLEYRLTAYAPEQEVTDLRLQSTMENRRGDLFLTVERRLHGDPPVLVKVIPISREFFDGVKVARNMVPLVLVAGEGKIAASIVQGGAKRA